MAYYTLIAREVHNGKLTSWAIQFGDYDRATVKAEMDDYFDHDSQFCAMKIVKTLSAQQSEIDALVALENSDG